MQFNKQKLIWKRTDNKHRSTKALKLSSLSHHFRFFRATALSCSAQVCGSCFRVLVIQVRSLTAVPFQWVCVRACVCVFLVMAIVRKNTRFGKPDLKIPYVRLILFSLRIFLVCPLTYDGANFHVEEKLRGSLLYIGFNLCCAVVFRATPIFPRFPDGRDPSPFGGGSPPSFERPPQQILYQTVIHASQWFGMATNVITILLNVRDRKLLCTCVSQLQQLWRM